MSEKSFTLMPKNLFSSLTGRFYRREVTMIYLAGPKMFCTLHARAQPSSSEIHDRRSGNELHLIPVPYHLLIGSYSNSLSLATSKSIKTLLKRNTVPSFLSTGIAWWPLKIFIVFRNANAASYLQSVPLEKTCSQACTHSVVKSAWWSQNT